MRFYWGAALLLAMLSALRTNYDQDTAPLATPAESASTPAPYILHVYANLVQVPMLALNANFKSLPPLTANGVDLSLDSGPIFHPTKMHVEGDEPIALGIVLDASGNQDQLLHHFAASAEAMATSSLRPRDHLTLYATDCKILRSSLNFPIGPLLLKTAVEHALSAESLHGGKDRGSCGRSLRLWDTASIAMKELGRQPGRRMLLIVSEGDDRKSTYSWSILRNFANDYSIAVFGLRDLDRFSGEIGAPLHLRDAGVYSNPDNPREEHFRDLCEATGGLILTTPDSQLTASLERLIAMMRGRYILEFPRANNSTPGRHTIDVTLPGQRAYIAVSGVTVEVPDANREKDPTTIPTGQSPAIMGKRPAPPNGR